MSALALLTQLAGKKVAKSTLDAVIKTAKSYIKANPGKSQVDILKNLETTYNIPLLRPEGKLSRGKMIPYPRHRASDLMKEIFTKNQLKKIDSEGFSAAKKQQWEKGILGTEEHLGKLKAAQKNQIDIGLKTKNPDTGEMGYHANPTIQNIIDFINSGGKSQSLGTFAKLQQNFAKQFGKGDLAKLRKPQNKELYADFTEAFNKRRMEAQLIKQGLLDEFTPANELLTKYGRQGWENVLAERQALTDLVFDESKIGQYLLDLGYDRNQIIASIGHDYPLEQFASLIGGKGIPNMTPFRATRLVTKPENIRAELNFMNQAKARGVEPFLYERPLWYGDDTGIMNKIMSDAQLTSKFYGPTGTRQQIGMPGKEIDPKQLLEYLKYIHKDKPFGSAKFPRTLPTRDDILALIHGKKKYNFQAGGLVGIGSKIIAKLAKKLSRQELKMMMGN